MDPLSMLTDPKRFFPGLEFIRRIFGWQGRKQYAHHWTVAQVADWCAVNFQEEKQLAHFIRIERRLGRFHMQLSQKYEYSAPQAYRQYGVGFFITHPPRKHRMPSDYQK